MQKRTDLSFCQYRLYDDDDDDDDDVYSRRVLRLSSGIDSMGPVMWDLALSLITAWVVVFFALFRGVKVVGKVGQTFFFQTVISQ